ncbi:hypothetical protein AWU68_1041 [Corynebacterium simulans]|uniref:Uncharacterized protein n=1 Tax=Corynebacterium simulans TaxID=146827 RepID=A0ABR5VC19_9CORY|nr:hypothetical protein WM42_0922 [Corynebacterium simulans]AMO91333.1 hypothetical protein AWU68_1041 [Corynebacterium simulans]KXU18888.1 hypothetical protein WM41_0421 [Corynebacterium simulans]
MSIEYLLVDARYLTSVEGVKIEVSKIHSSPNATNGALGY